jgi:FkbM family methyltransferase
MAFFLNELKQNGYLDDLHITIANIGSRKISQDDEYGQKSWNLFAPNLTILGFDADPQACDEANAAFELSSANWNEFHIPLAIGSQNGKAILNVTRSPMCSSLLLPNDLLLKRFLGLPELVSLDHKEEIDLVTLDSFCESEEIQEIDFLQIDVQGAALQVLQGAETLLSKSVFAVQVEVEFSPLYKDEALFAEVDRYMRSQGFVLFDMCLPHRGLRSPLRSQQRPGQILWTDLVYLRDPLLEDSPAWCKTPEMIFKLACIADTLDFTDYALELLEYLVLNYADDNPAFNLSTIIVRSIAQVPELIVEGLEDFPTIRNIKKYITIPLEQFKVVMQETFLPPVESFTTMNYMRHNSRRLEHLASLGLEIAGKSVLELGAGIGDHTHFFLDRGCSITTTEGRKENLAILQQRYPELNVQYLDLENPDPNFSIKAEIIYSYGLLYHLQNPQEALQFMSDCCLNILLLETVVSYGSDLSENLCDEPAASYTQSVSGKACRPTRPWIFTELQKHFEYVYMPSTQPNHAEFPIDWTTQIDPQQRFARSVFIASRTPINNPLLVSSILMKQQRH